ncbi:electron transport complex subunit RsxG [Teredinibacter franksiae]|uniref:electron transport complex subunit RsxG n=1 Tax=Teredinibacter franksiae TaxID=2761453 RepID=UPI0016280FD3|nr:electron transport complex subunit RsxG [Teredinibacter franksiae]
MLTQSISKNSLILAAFALVTAGILAVTYQATAERIAEEERKAAQAALLEIVPATRHDNDMLSHTFSIPQYLLAELGLKNNANIHLAYNNDEPVAAIVPALAPDGYSGDIKLIIGINADGSLAGVRVLTHKETPGLGDKIDLRKSDWILGFNGKSLTNPNIEQWAVKKDGGHFDQFTGATITPRAVVQRVKQTLQFYSTHRALIFEKSE